MLIPKWLEKIHYTQTYDCLARILSSTEGKKEAKLRKQIDDILRRPPDNPIWDNEKYWKEIYPKLVDDYTDELEKNSRIRLDNYEWMRICKDFIEGKTINYDI